MKKAFVTHLSSQDITEKTAKVDLVVPFLEGKLNPFDVQTLLKDVRHAVTDLDTEEDYVIPAGSAVANFIAGIAIGMRGPRTLKLKIFDATIGKYKEVLLILEKKKCQTPKTAE